MAPGQGGDRRRPGCHSECHPNVPCNSLESRSIHRNPGPQYYRPRSQFVHHSAPIPFFINDTPSSIKHHPEANCSSHTKDWPPAPTVDLVNWGSDSPSTPTRFRLGHPHPSRPGSPIGQPPRLPNHHVLLFPRSQPSLHPIASPSSSTPASTPRPAASPAILFHPSPFPPLSLQPSVTGAHTSADPSALPNHVDTRFRGEPAPKGLAGVQER